MRRWDERGFKGEGGGGKEGWVRALGWWRLCLHSEGNMIA